MGYPSDLTDDEWELIKEHFVRTDPRGARAEHDTRHIVNAILYVTRGGIQWRMLPSDFPPWGTVYDHYRNWNYRGLWETVLADLTKLHRVKSGRNETPSYGIIDSQSAKTVYAAEERGYDGGKKNQRKKASYRD